MKWAASAAIVVLAVAGVSAAKEHVAQRFEVTGTVQADGSLEVVEVIAFRFTGGMFTRINRELRTAETDGVEVIEASMDGRALPLGDGEGQIEIDAGRRRTRVTWRFAPTQDRVHVFALRYRYTGIVRHGEGEDWFRWPPFPSRFDYPIETGTARLLWPAGARLRVEPGVAGAVGSAEPLEHGIAVSVVNYRQRDDDVMLTARFEPGAFPGQEPEWQRTARRAASMAPAFVAGAAMIAAATALAMWVFFLRYRRDGIEPSVSDASVTDPPADLPPALGGAIVTGRVAAGWPQLFATVFELARQGAIEIVEVPAARANRRRAFVLRRRGDGALRPHERAVVELLFRDGAREQDFVAALRRLGGRLGTVKRAMRAELTQERMLDTDRHQGAAALGVSGFVVMAVAGVLGFALAATGFPFGEVAMFLPGALFLSGLAMVLIGTGFSTLTPAGLRAARRWGSYRRHLKAEIKAGRLPQDGARVAHLLPYAAALGQLPAFGKALQKADVRNLPPWLRTLDPDGSGSGAAIAALIAAGSSPLSHGAAAGRPST
jgi:hypothetical protein